MTNNNMMNQLASFLQNPAEFLTKNMGVTEDLAKDPDALIEKMMAEGRVSQAQYNQARQMAQQIQKNPAFMNMFKK